MDSVSCPAANNNDSIETSNQSERFSISSSCSLFDFAVYTVVMGTLCALGVIGNTVSFAVLLRDRGRSATCFLLQALALADTLVLIAAVPLYVLPPIYPFTGLMDGYYRTYPRIMSVLWPLYLMPYTATVFITVLVSLHRYCAVCKPSPCHTSSKVLLFTLIIMNIFIYL